MATIIGGDYKPVEVETLDLIGYLGKGEFVILNPMKRPNRKLPDQTATLGAIPMCTRCVIKNNQVVNFHGEAATLHDINGEWHYKWNDTDSPIRKLEPHNFFEVGNSR